MTEPKFCLQCGEEIVLGSHRNKKELATRKFCSRSCSAIHRNYKHGERGANDPTEEEIWGPGGYAEQLREKQLEVLRRRKT